MSAPVSHGRGGAANIRPDDTVYADGGIVREGPLGDQGDGNYSSGRGGQGNIGGDSHATAAGHAPGDDEIVPETAMRIAKEESRHVGRGGAGNEMHVHNKTEGTAEKLKDKLSGLFGGKKA